VKREIHQSQRLKRQRAFQRGQELISEGVKVRSKDALQDAACFDHDRNKVWGKLCQARLNQMLKQVFCLSLRGVSVLGETRPLEDSQKSAPLPHALRFRLIIEPSKTALDQFNIADGRDLVLTYKVRFQMHQGAIGPSIDCCQIAVYRIDVNARRTPALVKLIVHQDTLG
jgi:hypothetical protein